MFIDIVEYIIPLTFDSLSHPGPSPYLVESPYSFKHKNQPKK